MISLKTKLSIPLVIWFSVTGAIWLIFNNYLFINGFIEVAESDMRLHLEYLLENNLSVETVSASREERIMKFREIIDQGIFGTKKIIFFDSKGGVIYSSEEDEIDKTFTSVPVANENFKKTLQGFSESEFSYKEEEAGKFKDRLSIEIYYPLKISGNIIGVIEVWQPFDTQLALIIKNSIILVSFAMMVLLFFWLAMGFALDRFLYKDFKNIYKVMELVKKGDYSKRIDSNGSKETNDLINFFNNLSSAIEKNQEELIKAKESLEVQVKDRTAELQSAKQNLEKQVEEQTKKLREKLEQLEKFKNETIGRELRIIELKKEIEKLRNKN